MRQLADDLRRIVGDGESDLGHQHRHDADAPPLRLFGDGVVAPVCSRPADHLAKKAKSPRLRWPSGPLDAAIGKSNAEHPGKRDLHRSVAGRALKTPVTEPLTNAGGGEIL